MLNDNTLHDEISYQGKPLTVDTCMLEQYLNNPYETMALRPGGKEIECIRSATEEDARRVHSLMLKKYTQPAEQTTPKAPAPLTGKYAKLRDDLLAAYDETEHIEQTEDGGTCNFDAPVLHLDRWDSKKIKQAAKEAGGSAFKWTWGSRVMGWVFSPRSSGQANRRSRRAEAISEALKAKGYNAGMYYAMD